MKRISGWILFIPGLLFLIGLVSCRPNPPQELKPAVYFWKSRFENDSVQQAFLKNTGINKMYVRFFDVDWSEEAQMPYPLSKIRAISGFPDGVEIVPVIYIRNRVFQKIDKDSIGAFAANIYKTIQSISKASDIQSLVEIQFDCDWSLSSRINYFTFLDVFRTQSSDSILLSATIRLHQVKFFIKTGVPPVDRGMLMYYNMVSLRQLKKHNSIYDKKIAALYLQNFDSYPLFLDLALPTFSQCLHFRRDGSVGLIPGTTLARLNSFSVLRPLDGSWFFANTNFYIDKAQILAGDSLRFDAISKKECLKAANQIAPFIKNDNLQITFYLMDYLIDNNYSYEDLQDILSCFR